MEGNEVAGMLSGQAEIWQHLFSFVDSMALKCAVELRIADIIHSHSSPITLSQIASSIPNSTSPNISYLERIMRSLVHKKIFTTHHPLDGCGETCYGVNPEYSKWLLWESETSLAPVILAENHPWLINAWHHLSHSVRDGVVAYKKAHGHGIFEFASAKPEFNKFFNDAMACMAKMVMKAVLSTYKDGFGSIGSLVDVAGGNGGDIYEIVKSHPHIKGFNLDLPHVIATAPSYDGITHVVGDMFEHIPNADAIFIKFVLHNWSHEQCVKILRNCRNAIPEKIGKVVIVDIVLNLPENNGDVFDETRMTFDLLMMTLTGHGKERNELEWKKLLQEGGFPRYKIINIPAIPSIIEAYPI